ncbi:MAG: tail fiber domain-containing protein [Acidobacteriota bacterium]
MSNIRRSIKTVVPTAAATFALAACLTVPAFAAPTVANTALNPAGATFQVTATDYAGVELTVTGPNAFVFEKNFAAGEFVGVDLNEFAGVVDGVYTYELVVRPNVDADALEAARAAGVSPVAASTNNVQSGTFRVLNGSVVSAILEEPAAAGANPVGDIDVPTEMQVFAEDLIVQGSTCLGVDCTTSESFGFDTVRLKENNLRLHFNDTSSSASFPGNDWRLIANDSSNGGANYLAIEDGDTNRQVFRVDAGAPANSLRVDDEGNVGVGTATPVLQLHVVDGNSPALRLEQDGSNGFQSQTWDLSGNETNFFIRDVTNSSKLPFKIIPNAPTNALYVASSGNIGFGTASPDASLDIERTDGTATILVTENSTTAANRELLTLDNNGRVRMALINDSIADGTAGRKWVYDVNNGGNFSIIDLSDANVEMLLTNTGNMTIGGTLTENSDINTKTNIEEVDTTQVLDSILTLPISTWSYINGEPDVQHLGPMAQDFYALFGLGIAENKIATIDVAGVAIAAIQGLNEKVDSKDAEIESLKAERTELNNRLDALEAMVRELANNSGN